MTDNLPDDLTDRVEDMVRRRMDDKLATKEEIIDELLSYGAFTGVDRQELKDTPISVLEREAESAIPGAVRTDDGLMLDAGDATANELDVDPDDFSTGEIGGATDASGSTAIDFTRDAYDADDPTANDELEDPDFDDFSSGVIGE